MAAPSSKPGDRARQPAAGGAFAVVFLSVLLAACTAQKPAAPVLSPEAFEDRLGRGIEAMRRGDFGQAAAELEHAVRLKPESAKAHNYLGMAHEKLQEHDRARASFERAVALDPSFAAAFNNLGSLYLLEEDHAHAAEMFAKAVAIDPDLPAANFNLGNALLALGRTREAMPYLIEALRLDPDFLDSRSTLVVHTSAESLAGPETLFLYAKLYAAAGNLEKTVEYLGKARRNGFRDWQRIVTDKEFDAVRADPRVQEFLPR